MRIQDQTNGQSSDPTKSIDSNFEQIIPELSLSSQASMPIGSKGSIGLTMGASVMILCALVAYQFQSNGAGADLASSSEPPAVPKVIDKPVEPAVAIARTSIPIIKSPKTQLKVPQSAHQAEVLNLLRETKKEILAGYDSYLVNSGASSAERNQFRAMFNRRWKDAENEFLGPISPEQWNNATAEKLAAISGKIQNYVKLDLSLIELKAEQRAIVIATEKHMPNIDRKDFLSARLQLLKERLPQQIGDVVFTMAAQVRGEKLSELILPTDRGDELKNAIASNIRARMEMQRAAESAAPLVKTLPTPKGR